MAMIRAQQLNPNIKIHHDYKNTIKRHRFPFVERQYAYIFFIIIENNYFKDSSKMGKGLF